MKIAISNIIIGKRLRTIDKDRVAKLASSIKEVGLLNPITLTTTNNLVAGAHRIEACKLLDWTEIEYTVIDVSALLTELAEIDENLIRHDLNFLEKGNHLVRRKIIYETLYPDTKVGGDRKSEIKSQILASDKIPSFVETTAKETGLSKSTIKESMQIVNDIVPEFKDAITGTNITKTQALTVSKLEPDTQKKVLNEMKAIAQSKFGRSDIVLLSSKKPDEQKEAVSMVTRGDSRTLKEALIKLDLATSKPDSIEEYTCICGKIIKINWTAHTIED